MASLKSTGRLLLKPQQCDELKRNSELRMKWKLALRQNFILVPKMMQSVSFVSEHDK